VCSYFDGEQGAKSGEIESCAFSSHFLGLRNKLALSPADDERLIDFTGWPMTYVTDGQECDELLSRWPWLEPLN
jgi:hypothetical protein